MGSPFEGCYRPETVGTKADLFPSKICCKGLLTGHNSLIDIVWERRHSELSPGGRSLTCPSLCQNYFRNQVDGAARIRVDNWGSGARGQGIDDGGKD